MASPNQSIPPGFKIVSDPNTTAQRSTGLPPGFRVVHDPNTPTGQDRGTLEYQSWGQAKQEAQLFRALGDRVPDPSVPLPNAQPLQMSPMGGLSRAGQPPSGVARMRQQRQAYNALVSRGYSRQDIETLHGMMREAEPKPGEIKDLMAIAGGFLFGSIPPFTASPVEEGVAINRAARMIKGIGRLAGRSGAVGAVALGGQMAQLAAENRNMPTINEALGTVLSEAGFEAGAVGTTKMIEAGLSPIIKKTVPEAAETLDMIKRFGQNYTPATRDKRLSIRIVEAISRGSFGGEEIFRKKDADLDQMTELIAKNLLDDMAKGSANLSDGELGRLLLNTFEPGGTKWTLVDDIVGPLYEQFDDLAKTTTRKITQQVPLSAQEMIDRGMTPLFDQQGNLLNPKTVTKVVGTQTTGGVVKTKDLKRFAIDLLKQDRNVVRRGKGAILTDAGRSELQKIANLQPKVGAADLRKVRSRVLSLERQMAYDRSSDTGIIRKISGLTNEALFDDSLAAAVPPKAKDLLRTINSFYKEASDLYGKTFSKNLLKTLARDPSRAKTILANVSDPEKIGQMKRALTTIPVRTNKGMKFVPDREGMAYWDLLRKSYFTDLVEKSTTPSQGVREVSFLKRFNQIDRKTLKVLLSQQEIDQFEKFGKVLDLLNSRRKSGGGTSLFAKGIQMTALGALAAGQVSDYPGEPSLLQALIFAGGPVAFAAAAVDPGFTKLITAGLKAPKGTREFTVATARAIRYLNDKRREADNQYIRILKRERDKELFRSREAGAERVEAQGFPSPGP